MGPKICNAPPPAACHISFLSTGAGWLVKGKSEGKKRAGEEMGGGGAGMREHNARKSNKVTWIIEDATCQMIKQVAEGIPVISETLSYDAQVKKHL